MIRSILEAPISERKQAVRFSSELDTQLMWSRVDTTQIRMVLEAVLANAIESTHHDGEVDISTANLFAADVQMPFQLGLSQRNYVVIRIRDNGQGMDQTTCQRVTEPFFTT